MTERPVMSLPEAQALAERLKSIPADRATMMRETQAILALGDEVARLAAELAGAREAVTRWAKARHRFHQPMPYGPLEQAAGEYNDACTTLEGLVSQPCESCDGHGGSVDQQGNAEECGDCRGSGVALAKCGDGAE